MDSNIHEVITLQRTIMGLHRPFNKPLKSLCWVCMFARKWNKGTKDNFYYKFYISHIKNIVKRGNMNNPWSEGCISLSDANTILKIASNCDLESRISEVLQKRETDEERLIYKTYKNTSYYISLAKKMALINSDYKPTKDGLELSSAYRHFYTLSKCEKKLIFRFLLEVNADLIIALILTKREVEKGEYPTHLSLIYQKSMGNDFDRKYVRSFKDNYLLVMMSWISQLDITKKIGGLKIEWEIFLKNYPEYYQKYLSQQSSYGIFKKNILKRELAKSKQYKRLLESYEKLYATGKTDLGYVNLYDIMSDLRMGYDRFSKLINEFYVENKKNIIILLSNTVSSIDKRRRFQIGDKVILKIRIIKKKEYEFGGTLGDINS